MKYGLLLIALILPMLCSCTNIVTTSKPVITHPSDHDFRFVGKWELVPDPNFPKDNREIINISRDAETRTKYIAKDEGDDPLPDYLFTTSRISDEAEYALVQVGKKPNYYYGYAVRKDDHLYVWMIQGDELVKLIESEKLKSVIDRSGLNTHITADSAKLLEMLSKNSRTLALKTPKAFKLIQ